MRLLIVDDDEDIRTMLKLGLEPDGYAVDVAADGEQGWEMGDVHNYDAVVLDLRLPKMNGLEVCRRLRQSNPTLAILVLTGSTDCADGIDALDGGADDYVTKPFDFALLRARLRAVLRRDMRTRRPVLEFKDIRLDPAGRTVLTDSQAVDLAVQEFGDVVRNVPHADEYGAFTDNAYQRDAGTGLKPVGTLDVWEVAFSGLSLDRPCPATDDPSTPDTSGSCPPITTLAVLIDDKGGAYLEAQGF